MTPAVLKATLLFLLLSLPLTSMLLPFLLSWVDIAALSWSVQTDRSGSTPLTAVEPLPGGLLPTSLAGLTMTDVCVLQLRLVLKPHLNYSGCFATAAVLSSLLLLLPLLLLLLPLLLLPRLLPRLLLLLLCKHASNSVTALARRSVSCRRCVALLFIQMLSKANGFSVRR